MDDARRAGQAGIAKARQDDPGYQPTDEDWERLFQSIEEKSRIARLYVDRVLEKQIKHRM